MNTFGLPELTLLGGWVLAWMVFVVIVASLRRHFRLRQLEMLHRERMAAIEKGLPPPEPHPALSNDELLHGWMARHRDNPRRPLAAAIIFGMFGGGLMTAMIMTHELKWPYALIPIFLSLGFVLQYFLMKPRD